MLLQKCIGEPASDKFNLFLLIHEKSTFERVWMGLVCASHTIVGVGIRTRLIHDLRFENADQSVHV